MEPGVEYDIHTCVIDGDSVANGSARGTESLVSAIVQLQAKQLKVLVVTDPTSDVLRRVLEEAPDIQQRAMHVMPLPYTGSILTTAKDYTCCFALERRSKWLQDWEAHQWHLPIAVRHWVQVCREELQVVYEIRSDGRVTFSWPSHLADPAPATPRRNPPQPIDTSLSPPQGQTGTQADPAAAVNLCIISALHDGVQQTLLCVFCEDPGADYFQSAKGLAQSLTKGEIEEFDGSSAPDSAVLGPIKEGLKLRGPPWSNVRPIMLAAVISGPHAGLRAVGLGSNIQKRKRATHLALAVTAALHSPGPSGEPPEGLQPLVAAAKRALRDNAANAGA